jgi:predicted DNA-binding transcriptional regulator AlpA
MQLLLNERQTATMLNISVRTLQRLRAIGNGPVYVKLGRLVRYQSDAVDNYLAACTRKSTSQGGCAV